MAGAKNAPGRDIPRQIGKPKRALKKLRPQIQEIVKTVTKPIKLFFQDEARFGRISQQVGCWSPVGQRPVVPAQHIREYTYSYTAACPLDGTTVSLILPDMSTQCLNRFLLEVSLRHPNEHVVMVMDGAASHRSKELKIPENMTLIHLPAYSPELNPVENFWKILRASGFYNRVFKTMDEVEALLIKQLKYFEDNIHLVVSAVGFDWILNALI